MSRSEFDPPQRISDFDIELELLLEAIYLKYQHDFRHYAMSLLRRRLTAHAGSGGIRAAFAVATAGPYHAQRRRIFAAVPVPHGAGQRHVPRPRVFPRVARTCAAAPAHVSVNQGVVAGCSPGEELWSLKILFDEKGLTERTLFYATDINPDALARAEAGIYSLERIQGLTQNYLAAGGKRSLSDYYHAAYGGAHFAGSLKDRVVFADHSLSTDEVFLEAHLVSCRNVLIYFDRNLQDRALGLFENALVRLGFLGLGSKESLRFSRHYEAFDEFRPGERIYQKR